MYGMGTTSSRTKASRIDLRVDPGQKALFEQAAATQGKNLSDFMIGASAIAAELALADQNRFVLPEDSMEKFLSMLEEEPKVVPKLRELFLRNSVLE